MGSTKNLSGHLQNKHKEFCETEKKSSQELIPKCNLDRYLISSQVNNYIFGAPVYTF